MYATTTKRFKKKSLALLIGAALGLSGQLSAAEEEAKEDQENAEEAVSTPKKEKNALELIHTGTLDGGSQNVGGQTASAFDWGASSGPKTGGQLEDDLDLDFSIDAAYEKVKIKPLL